MGYTHYWQRPIKLPPKKFGRAVEDCRRLLPQIGIPLGGAWGDGSPRFEPTVIVFNGPKGNYCETFRIEQKSCGRPRGLEVLEFCKTAHLPYDLAVQIVLIIFKRYLGASFKVSSDGSDADWDNARRISHEKLGYGADFQLDRD